MKPVILAALLALLSSACILDEVVGGECLPGSVPCDGRCVDVRRDANNCGACGYECSEGGSCVAGLCVGGGCEPPEVWCDGAACADLATDPANCGGCGVACDDGERCSDGECVGVECPEGTIDCDGACVDPHADPRHCGGCGQDCDFGTFCVQGDCVEGCPDDTVACGQMCVDTSDDPRNCGGCGIDCGKTGVCVSGTCQECPADHVRCGKECADVSADDDHCGACATTCDALDSCDDGTCVLHCPDGLVDCRTGRCVDPGEDPDHCGACGVECTDGESCLDGRCVDECGDGLWSCGRQCVDVTSDPDNCGGCGVVCDTGICEDGSCRGGEVGHLVLIGHDYAESRRDQSRLVTNAALLRDGPVRIVTYGQYADVAAVRNVDDAILTRAGELGRTVGFTQLGDAQLLEPALLEADVLLLYAQPSAELDTLEALGELWSDVLVSFLARGGVVVALHTHQILQSAGLVSIDTARDATGEELRVTGAGDAVASGMSASYRAEETTVAFTTTDDNAVVTVGDEVVVLHEVFLP